MTNRNPVKQLFLTFPKSTIDKHQFRDDLLRFEPDYYKVVEEKHKDGTPHLHAVVRFKNKYSKAFVLKHFKTLYPDDYKRIDIKPVRSIKNAIKYLSKEDPEPLTTGEYKDGRQPKFHWLNKLAREWGYNDSKDFIKRTHQEHKRFLAERHVILEEYHEHVKWFSQFENFSVPYDILKIYEKLCAEIRIPKDDITKITTYLKITL